MGRIFNIAGPCRDGKHYMLPALGRLPHVRRLVEDESYFVLHAPRQCGKTTAVQALASEINAGKERVALYCSVEAVQEFIDPKEGLPEIAGQIRDAVQAAAPETFGGLTDAGLKKMVGEVDLANVVKRTLNVLAEHCGGKQLVVFFDEVDCLSDGTLVGFLRQLRNGRITYERSGAFPSAMALIGMRNIRDFKARIRPDSESLGSASPFNVINEATTLRMFTLDEVGQLYRQHTDETGQVWESGVVERAYEYSGGQPYLVNALARWCVDKIHDRRYDEPITLGDMHEAREKIIRERGTHLDSIMERMKEPQVRRVVEPVMTGEDFDQNALADDLSYVLDLGLLAFDDDRMLRPANPMYSEIIGRYLSCGTQQKIRLDVQKMPWVKDDGLNMAGLMATFQQFWRENADRAAVPFPFREAYPQLVLQSFLQRIINGGGEIVREMAFGVLFRGARYAVECKKASFYEKSPEKAYDQVCGYMDRLGATEGWLVVFDPDLTKPCEDKIGFDEVDWSGKRVHVVRC